MINLQIYLCASDKKADTTCFKDYEEWKERGKKIEMQFVNIKSQVSVVTSQLK